MTAKTCIQYAQKEPRREGDGWFWCHFTSHPRTTRLYDNSLPVFEVRVTEDKGGDHWSWWDNKDGEFCFTSLHKSGVTICFPYAIEGYAEQGEGFLLKVRVEELRQL